jgi:ABC-type uncharacterized transport system permease subunit
VLNLGIEGIFTAGRHGRLDGRLARRRALGRRAGRRDWPAGSSGLIHAILTVPLGLSQHVSGIGVTLFATSLSYFIYRTALPDVSSPPRIEAFRPLDIPGLSDLPFLGPGPVPADTADLPGAGAGDRDRLCALPHPARPRDPGRRRQSVPPWNPRASPSTAIRMGTVVAGSAIMALGGAFLTMSAFDAFFFGMVNGRGWICIALTVFASWRPGKALIGALLFGAFDAFQVRLQTEVGSFIPGQVFLMMPYLLSIAALIVVARRADYPRALLVPYFRGQR